MHSTVNCVKVKLRHYLVFDLWSVPEYFTAAGTIYYTLQAEGNYLVLDLWSAQCGWLGGANKEGGCNCMYIIRHTYCQCVGVADLSLDVPGHEEDLQVVSGRGGQWGGGGGRV